MYLPFSLFAWLIKKFRCAKRGSFLPQFLYFDILHVRQIYLVRYLDESFLVFCDRILFLMQIELQLIELNYNKEREIFRAMLVIMTNSKIVEQQRLSSVKHQTSFHSNWNDSIEIMFVFSAFTDVRRHPRWRRKSNIYPGCLYRKRQPWTPNTLSASTRPTPWRGTRCW